MIHRSLALRSAVAAMSAAALMLSVEVASAHVTVQPKEAPADSYFQLTFTVPHGCDGSVTTALRIKLPDGILSAKPQMKPGWTVAVKMKKLATPQQDPHGKTVSEVVDEVAWRGGPLPDNLYDSFGIIVRLPNQPNQDLYFPTVQECEKGVARWIEIPTGSQSADRLHMPAPVIRLKAKSP